MSRSHFIWQNSQPKLVYFSWNVFDETFQHDLEKQLCKHKGLDLCANTWNVWRSSDDKSFETLRQSLNPADDSFPLFLFRLGSIVLQSSKVYI